MIHLNARIKTVEYCIQLGVHGWLQLGRVIKSQANVIRSMGNINTAKGSKLGSVGKLQKIKHRIAAKSLGGTNTKKTYQRY